MSAHNSKAKWYGVVAECTDGSVTSAFDVCGTREAAEKKCSERNANLGMAPRQVRKFKVLEYEFTEFQKPA